MAILGAPSPPQAGPGQPTEWGQSLQAKRLRVDLEDGPRNCSKRSKPWPAKSLPKGTQRPELGAGQGEPTGCCHRAVDMGPPGSRMCPVSL